LLSQERMNYFIVAVQSQLKFKLNWAELKWFKPSVNFIYALHFVCTRCTYVAYLSIYLATPHIQCTSDLVLNNWKALGQLYRCCHHPYHPRWYQWWLPPPESFTAGQRKIETLKVAPFFILNTKINLPWYPVACVKIWKEFPEPPVTMGIGASSPLTLKMMLVDPACRGKTFSCWMFGLGPWADTVTLTLAFKARTTWISNEVDWTGRNILSPHDKYHGAAEVGREDGRRTQINLHCMELHAKTFVRLVFLTLERLAIDTQQSETGRT